MVNDKDVRKVLKAYGIQASKVEHEAKNRYLIQEDTQLLLLHKNTIDQNQISRWESVFHYANEYKLKSIVPVYPTINGELYVKEKGDIFYITPYIQSDDSRDIVDLYKTMADIHTKTKRTFLIEKNELSKTFSLYQEEVRAKRLYFWQVIDLFEQQTYMSPLELQVCSHFHIIDDVFDKIIERISSLLQRCEENETKHMEWFSSLSHNQLSTERVLNNRLQYIAEWEAASFANATTDIAVFCKNEFLRNEYPLDRFIKGLTAYHEIYPLHPVEEDILAIHLLHPLTYVKTLQDFMQTRQEKSIIHTVIEIERIFRVIANSFFLLQEFEQQKPNMFQDTND